MFEQKEGESDDDYLERLFGIGDQSVKNLKKNSNEMKRLGITGFCSECGCNIYKDKEHSC